MKKILKGIFILLFIVLLSACTKDYKAITYTKFIETFQEEGYIVNNSSSQQSDKYERFIEASGKNNQFTYMEFKDEEEARNYVKTNYSKKKNYKYKDKKNYITVKSTKERYFSLIQIDKIVIVGNTYTKSNKKEVNRMLKKLGY